MKLLYTAANPMLVSHAANLLEAAGIEAEVRHLYLGGGAGDLPLNEVWPEVWVEEADFQRAEEVLVQTDNTATHPWRCHRCGELCEAQFSLCWQCGSPRDE